MIGVVLSIVLLGSVVSAGFDSETYPWFAPYLYALGLLVLAFVVGTVFVRTVGIAAVGLVPGGLIAAVIAVTQGAYGAAPGFLLIAGAGMFIGNAQRQRAAYQARY